MSSPLRRLIGDLFGTAESLQRLGVIVKAKNQ